MKITIEVKNVYGNTLYYPVCEQAKLFAKIAETTTLTYHAIQHIKALGYAIEATRTVEEL